MICCCERKIVWQWNGTSFTGWLAVSLVVVSCCRCCHCYRPILSCLYIAFYTHTHTCPIQSQHYFFRWFQILALHKNLPSVCSLQWNTSFPAITVCEMFNGEKTWDLSEKYAIDSSPFFIWRQNATQIRFPDRKILIVKIIQFILAYYLASTDFTEAIGTTN